MNSPARDGRCDGRDDDRNLHVTIALGFAVLMLLVNIMLVVFNMIPAFPMDGGRVFRSLLAMVMDYRKATSIASRVGLVCAALIAFFALSANPPNPIPVLIAAFVGYAGLGEARQVEVMESVRGLTASQVMIRTNLSLPMDMPLAEIVSSNGNGFRCPRCRCCRITGTVVGMLELTRCRQKRFARSGPGHHCRAIDRPRIFDRHVSASTKIWNRRCLRTGKHRRQIPVVGRPRGIDWNTRSRFDAGTSAN